MQTHRPIVESTHLPTPNQLFARSASRTMFTRRAFYHPYKPTAHFSPAGFRIADYIKPKGCFNLFQDDTNTHDHPPTLRLADLFAGNGFGPPQCPSTTSPDHPRNATPHVPQTDVRVQEPQLRKRRYGPKHLSFNNGALRSGLVAPRRRKRILDRNEHRVVRAREHIDSLRREAEALMKPDCMNEQDRIFLKQLRGLHLDQVLKHDLEQCRQRMTRAANESTVRRQEHEERDEEAAKMWGEGRDEVAREEQERKVDAFVREKVGRSDSHRRRVEEKAFRADEERQRVHEAQERKIREEQEYLFHQEVARKAKEEEERRKREEQERREQEEREQRLREERERQLREEREQRLREERERELREKERQLREEVERLRREAHERFLREESERLAREEGERQARILAEQARRAAQDDQTRQYFVLYEAKWNELRTNKSLPPVDVQEMPWPVFGVVSSAEQITYQDVRTFLFHPQRPGVEGKTARDKVKSEVLRFHPDKFNARILPKIQPSQRVVAEEITGAIARILTRVMTEEVEQQK
ncbi:hypothetical protein J3R82DRAFT_6639 [Butyriboletus roseoflavus]|nr:hypothetical protein J3R82DRAFT_6639 [Butyriboletus roseoflavus]